jgi:hypothetical protein
MFDIYALLILPDDLIKISKQGVCVHRPLRLLSCGGLYYYRQRTTWWALSAVSCDRCLDWASLLHNTIIYFLLGTGFKARRVNNIIKISWNSVTIITKNLFVKNQK